MADKKRRASMRVFHSRSETPTSIVTSIPSNTSSPVESRSPRMYTPHIQTASADTQVAKGRPRVLQREKRSSNIGSLRSLRSSDEDEKDALHSNSTPSSLYGDGGYSNQGHFGDTVKKSTELQAGGTSVFRKKSQYLVLTESHLVRFKNQNKASEVFPSIPSLAKNSFSRSTMSSISSYTELQSAAIHDVTQGVPLEDIVAVCKLEDGRPYFTIEVFFLNERTRKSGSMQLSMSDPRDADAWVATIRSSATATRLQYDRTTHPSTVEYLAQVLERSQDYDPAHFRIFKVAQRVPVRPAARAVQDDLIRTSSTVCFFVIGLNRVHFVPLPRTGDRSSSTSLVDLDVPSSFGVLSLSGVEVQSADDAFNLYFHAPLRQSYVAQLASNDSSQIALWLRYQCEFLRPEWCLQPFRFVVPDGLEDQMDPPTFLPEDNNCFDRTLIAFCAAADADVARIYYSVDYTCEDAPCFRLLPPATGPLYSPIELLVVLKALRYNEAFTSISFAHNNLRPLHDVYDRSDDDEDGSCTRSGGYVHLTGHAELSVLQHEIRALALKNRRLRRLDFSHTMPKPSSTRRGRSGCGIPEALVPLCKKSLTNVDWITLTGIALSDTDIEFLVDAASVRACHLRALEVGDCGLSIHDVDVLLSTLGIHDNTMEAIDISGVQGRFSSDLFQRAIGAFSRIRKLNLTRIQKAAGPEPLIAPEILLGWRLESLQLNGTTLNEQMIDAISAYLACPKSDTLRELSVNQCNLTGRDLAVLLSAMTRDSGVPRNMHVNANENRLGVDCGYLSRCVARNHAPAVLSMRTIDFQKETNFRELMYALTDNTTLKRLDISCASLPYDASTEACEALRDMFAKNSTLEEVDISGEVAHLDVARFGIGLNMALTGLNRNTALKVLRIEHQNLGLQGANTLAGVIEVNQSLLEIHCEHNGINLQSFTVLVNALSKNQTILYMPSQDADRIKSLAKVREEFGALERLTEPQSPKVGTIKKVINVRKSHGRYSSATSTNSVGSFTENDMTATLSALEEQWQVQVRRLHQYLARNHQVRMGAAWPDGNVEEDDGRPATAESLGQLLARVRLDRTPLADLVNSPLDMTEEPCPVRNSAVFTFPDD